jgi:nucleoside-diphosphate-sugar epimerase
VNALLTGATGFVGKCLAEVLDQQETYLLTCAVRTAGATQCGREVEIIGIDADTDWTTALIDQQVVIHAAARAHIMKDEVSDPLSEYRKVNVEGTLNLARQAVEAGVRRFIYISSIKVNGEWTPPGEPFTAEDTPAPEDHYGISKLEAEQGLQELAAETGMEVVIIRPPLVYGPGVKGNFASMMKLVGRELPLPLGAVQNSRSLVALDNLVDFVNTCISHPAAANQVFLVSDGEDLSTTELLRAIARAMGRRSRLIPVPARVLLFGASLLGKSAVAKRLLGSLQVDISKNRDMLGWHPPISVAEGMARAVGLPVG